ncbi:MSMEG_0567/sll0787 family protein [Rhodococcoides kyotonense]|uniref:Putative N-acetyltransferase, MSMEG_0567 N-terminal domain family n=1 Tax=Rhodococcoides kyotonense TaxID=398843 RepID=A0A239N573_9NOCA|nr:MSMEG_0567/sll0787 family protein [Rhodococcus kyotonensis]SNT49604.1 putative N-acetyltransferase, MSMEG_0567 N-terminal domain family [Rhodococcus kyotonensis]
MYTDLAGTAVATSQAPFLIQPCSSAVELDEYRRLRRDVFVTEQGLFAGTDQDDVDDDPRTVVLVARDADGTVLGGVRLSPCTAPDLGWWAGGRLVASTDARTSGVGPALVRAACAYAENQGVLRFDATVQIQNEALFTRLGWIRRFDVDVHGSPHVAMHWPIDRIERLVSSTKAMLAGVLAPLKAQPLGLGAKGFRGDDGVPVPGSDVIAACDAIIPSMVDRDPEWAGWCAALVNLNDLSAMGAGAVGMLDSVGAPTQSRLTRIIRGLANASQAWQVPVLGGHTQVGVPSSLSVTALGRATNPIRAGGASVGDVLTLTADVEGQWRRGYQGQQWDSSSRRNSSELSAMASFVARTAPKAAKDVSMAGLAGTTGMLAEACGTGAVLDVATVPKPEAASMGEWITCFPGFAMITADRPGAQLAPSGPAVSARCGELTDIPGVALRWPDGIITRAVTSTVTGLGEA